MPVYLLQILVSFCEAAGGDCCQRQDLGYDPVLQFLCSSALPKCYFKNSCLVACLKDKCNIAILGCEWISKLNIAVSTLTNYSWRKWMYASIQEENCIYLCLYIVSMCPVEHLYTFIYKPHVCTHSHDCLRSYHWSIDAYRSIYRESLCVHVYRLCGHFSSFFFSPTYKCQGKLCVNLT